MLKFGNQSEAEQGPELPGLWVRHLKVSYSASLWRKHKVLEGVDLNVPADEGLLIVGPSGAGKTTLLRALAGELSVDSGQIWSQGRPVSRRKRVKCFAYVPETPRFSERHTVEEVLYQWGGVAVRKKKGRLESLGELGLSDHVKKPASSLSAGLAKRLAWAIALAKDGIEGFLLDEPISSLDLAWQDQILFYIGRELSLGRFALIASHDSAKYFDLCSRQVQLKYGLISELGGDHQREASIRAHPGGTEGLTQMNHVFAMDIRGLNLDEIKEIGKGFGLRGWDDAKVHPSGTKLFFSDYGLASAWLGRLLGCGVVITQFDERLDHVRVKTNFSHPSGDVLS